MDPIVEQLRALLALHKWSVAELHRRSGFGLDVSVLRLKLFGRRLKKKNERRRKHRYTPMTTAEASMLFAAFGCCLQLTPRSDIARPHRVASTPCRRQLQSGAA